MRRGLIVALAALLTGCTSQSDDSTYSQFYSLVKQSFATSFGKVRITRDQAAAVPFASMGIMLEGGNEVMLVLATDTGGDQLWTSASKLVVVTRDGRVVRTVGLPADVGSVSPRSVSAPPPSAAIKAPFISNRTEDFPDLGLYGTSITCRAAAISRQAIKIMGQAISTVRVDESCHDAGGRWSFTDIFWVDPQSGLVWRSQQHLHPKGEVLDIEILRPPG